MEECIMKDEYDFTKARKNPYAKKLKQQITIILMWTQQIISKNNPSSQGFLIKH